MPPQTHTCRFVLFAPFLCTALANPASHDCFCAAAFIATTACNDDHLLFCGNQSLFSLTPTWSVTPAGTDTFDDEKKEEAEVIQRVKERINKVLQNRLAGTFLCILDAYDG